ncbi:mitochondrial basic amino acids transporter-like [Watersipora subatra]|uniref:mitochondrial basic amino acids transporter-like n=1 Tax=Watersipora subatra TaxID=2589382 RepID=UPI00355B7CC8
MQCQPRSTYRGLIDCCKQIVKQETPRGLYRGLAAPLCTVSVTNSLCFGTFGCILRRFDDPKSVKSNFLAGAGTGLALSALYSPVELLKCKMQMQGIIARENRSVLSFRKPVYTFNSPVSCAQTIYKREGYSGLNRGLLATVVRRSPGLGIYFATNEFLHQLYKSQNQGGDNIPIWYLFMAGGVAGCTPWAILYPADVIKSRIQGDGVYHLQRKKFTYKYKGYVDCIRKSIRNEGYGVFYRGLSSTFLRTFPNNGVILTVVSLLKKMTESSSVYSEDLTVVDSTSVSS